MRNMDLMSSLQKSYADELKNIIISDTDRMGGIPCFTGTRIPVKYFFEHLEMGETVTGFLNSFPSVKHNQVIVLFKVFYNFVSESNENAVN